MTAALAAAIVAAGSGSQRRVLVEGRVTVSPGSSLASVTGIASEPVPVGKDNWFGSFITAAASGLSNRRVMVVFVDGQPYIADVIGV